MGNFKKAMPNLFDINKLYFNEYFNIIEPSCFDLISDFSLSLYGLIFLKNEIVLNNRTSILEFGSGISTLFMASVIKKFELNAKIITVENGQDWVNTLSKKIKELQLSEYIKVLHAPLINENKADQWYNKAILNDKIDENLKFDMILIDGPPAFHAGISKCRIEAVPFLQGKLALNCSIFLDDVNRNGEMEIIDIWNRCYDMKFKVYNNSIAVHRIGLAIRSDPGILSCLLTKQCSSSNRIPDK